MLAACLTYLSQPQFYTGLFRGYGVFIPIKGWAAALFSLCSSAILIDHRLMQLSQCMVQCTVKFCTVKNTVQYMLACTLHAEVKSRVVQQHPY